MGQCSGKPARISPEKHARGSLGTRTFRIRDFRDPEMMLIGIEGAGFSEEHAKIIQEAALDMLQNNEEQAQTTPSCLTFSQNAVVLWQRNEKIASLKELGRGYGLLLKKGSQGQHDLPMNKGKYLSSFIGTTNYPLASERGKLSKRRCSFSVQ